MIVPTRIIRSNPTILISLVSRPKVDDLKLIQNFERDYLYILYISPNGLFFNNSITNFNCWILKFNILLWNNQSNPTPCKYIISKRTRRPAFVVRFTYNFNLPAMTQSYISYLSKTPDEILFSMCDRNPNSNIFLTLISTFNLICNRKFRQFYQFYHRFYRNSDDISLFLLFVKIIHLC